MGECFASCGGEVLFCHTSALMGHFHPISTRESFYFSGCLLPPASEEAQLPLLNQGMLTVALQEGQVLSRHPSCVSP